MQRVGDRQTDRQTETETETDRDRDREIETERERGWELKQINIIGSLS